MRDHPGCLCCGKPFDPSARVDRKYCDRTCNNRHYKRIRAGKAAAPQDDDAAVILSRMTPAQLGWVAGIIEGEGCFSLNKGRKYSGNTYVYSHVTVSMCDEDIILRLHQWAGIGRMSGPHLPPCRAEAGYKPQWLWSVTKAAHVEALAEVLFPLMGARRQEQINRMRQAMAERTLIRAQ